MRAREGGRDNNRPAPLAAASRISARRIPDMEPIREGETESDGESEFLPPPSPDSMKFKDLPCGCFAEVCLFGEDERDGPDEEADVDSDYCGEISWRTAARVIDEVDSLLLDCLLPRRVERWVQREVAPRWKKSRGRWSLEPGEFASISRAVHRLHNPAVFTPRFEFIYKPMTRFVMRHPSEAAPEAAPAVMLKMEFPIGWIEATRDANGTLSYRRDDRRIAVDMKALKPSEYGTTWAERVAPSSRPVFASPEEIEEIPAEDRHWYVYSAGVKGWVPARRSEDGDWIQTLQGTDIQHPIYDVPGGEYGKDFGVLAPLYDGSLDRVYDRLVLHPQYQARWLGAYTSADGRLYAYSYPSDVEVHADLSPENFNRIWCWPPCRA